MANVSNDRAVGAMISGVMNVRNAAIEECVELLEYASPGDYGDVRGAVHKLLMELKGKMEARKWGPRDVADVIMAGVHKL